MKIRHEGPTVIGRRGKGGGAARPPFTNPEMAVLVAALVSAGAHVALQPSPAHRSGDPVTMLKRLHLTVVRCFVGLLTGVVLGRYSPSPKSCGPHGRRYSRRD